MSSHETRAHSHIGASSAHRWLNCSGCIRLSAGIEQETSIFAAEGTAAHELAERCLRGPKDNRFLDAADFIGEEIVVGNHVFEVDEEMADAVQLYVDTIKADYEPGDILFVERKFDLGHVWPGLFGTNDAGLYNVRSKTLRVYDLKYGRGHAVEAKENPQLIYYGIGMVNVDSLVGVQIDGVELIIVQPRAIHREGPVRRWMTDPVHLMDFQADLAEGAARTEDPNAPRTPGDWCNFCPAAGICPELREVALLKAQAEFADVIAPDLSESELAELLEKADLVECGIKAIRAEAFARANGGAKIPGWKLVPKRAVRKWKDEGTVVATLIVDHDVSSDDLWNRKLKSPAQVEKLLGKAGKDALADLVIKESSGNTFARDTDPRAEARPTRSAAHDFDPVE